MKFCIYCGNKLADGATFCTKCGKKQPTESQASNQAQQQTDQINQQQSQQSFQQQQQDFRKNYEQQYGQAGSQNDGQPNDRPNNQQFNQQFNQQQMPNHEGLYDMATGKLNSLTGNKGSVRVSLKILFSDVFKSHSSGEAEKIFIAGTHYTTPSMNDVSEQWAKPWLFSRVLMYFMIVFAALIAAAYIFGGVIAVPGLMLVSSIAVPFSAVIFYFECNAFRNISIFNVMKIFFIGGAFSLLITMFIYQFTMQSNSEEISLLGAFVIGLVEELGKMIIIYYFITKLRNNFILNGILIGGSVGAGFASFETLGYIFYSQNAYLETAILRAFTAVGGHLVWAAITGGALMLVKKYGQHLDVSELFTGQFMAFFGISVALHALWDWSFIDGWLKYIALTIIAWIVLFVLMNAGINQVRAIKEINKSQN